MPAPFGGNSPSLGTYSAGPAASVVGSAARHSDATANSAAARASRQDCWITLNTARGSRLTFLEQVARHEVFDECSQAIAVGAGSRGDGPDLRGVVDGHHASQGERGQLLDE